MQVACPTSIYAGLKPSLFRRTAHLAPSILASSYNLRSKSTTSPSNPPNPPNPSTATKDKVNPPTSTLPAPLSVPPRKPSQSFPSYLLSAGRAYLIFYKTGIKNIFANRRVAASLRQRLRSTQTPHLPPSSSYHGIGPRGPAIPTPQNLYSKYILTRGEFQLLRRSHHDMIRIPIFGVLFLILGEWLPLVAIFFTPLLPYTCRIPAQVEGERRVLERRRRSSFAGVTDGVVVVARLPTPGKEEVGLEGLSKGQLLHISRSLGLHGRVWDLSRGLLPPVLLVRWKVKRRLAYLEQDDALLVRDGSVETLRDEEVRIACEERGIDVLGQDVEMLRDLLQHWVDGWRENGSAFSRLLSLPTRFYDSGTGKNS